MSLLTKLGNGLRALVLRRKFETEMDDELRAYMDAMDAKMRDGMSRTAAERAVRVETGSLAAVKDNIRDAGWEVFLETSWQDVRYALRALRHSPGFTFVALASLSLGICIATCAISEMNGMVLRVLPGVAQPERLVTLQSPTSFPYYRNYRALKAIFSSTAAYVAPVPFTIAADGRSERSWGHLVTASYFSTFAVRPELGRTLDADDDQPGRAPVVVLSYHFWQNRFGRDRGIVGKTISVNGHTCTVVGVAAKQFLGASPLLLRSDLWLPLSVGARTRAGT